MERETNNGKASALGEAVVLYGDPNRVNTDLGQLQAVTADQMKEAMNRYLTNKKKVVIEYSTGSDEAERPNDEDQS